MRASQAQVAVVLAKAVGRCCLVQVLGFENEVNLLDVGGSGKFIYLVQSEGRGVFFLFGIHADTPVERYVAVVTQENEVGVVTLDDAFRLMAIGTAHHTDIEFVGVFLFQGDTDAPFVNKLPPSGHRRLVAVFQHFELVFRLPYQGTEGHSDGQAYHSSAGDAHAHRVFHDIGTEPQFHFFRRGAEQFFGLGHAQCHCYGLCTSYCGDHLLMHQLNDSLSFFLRQHKKIDVLCLVFECKFSKSLSNLQLLTEKNCWIKKKALPLPQI